jgi:osmotically-inducible protein OsmY
VLSNVIGARWAVRGHAGATAATLLGGILTATLTHASSTAAPGHLAELLATQRAGVVAAHVASSVRAELNASRLSLAWSAAVAEIGPLQRVSRHYVVQDGGGTQDELEALQFARGSGVLTARRTPAGITGLVLLIGGVNDERAATAASAYAQEVVAGQLQPVRARFDAEMTTALPAGVFSAATATATAGLLGPARVAGQIVVRRSALTVVETYLLFRNGLRRIEMTFQPNGSIAGLYISLL